MLKKKRDRKKNACTQMQHGDSSSQPKPPSRGESQPGRLTAADSPGQPRRSHAHKRGCNARWPGESLEAGAEARERAYQKIRDTAGASMELRMAAELGEEWIDILLDDKEPLPADLLLAIRAALQGPARGAAVGATKSFQDAVDITVPRRVKTEDINRYLEQAFGNTFKPLPESAEGKVCLRCTRKMADAMREGVTIRGEEIKDTRRRSKTPTTATKESPATTTREGSRDVGRKRVLTRTPREARPRSGL